MMQAAAATAAAASSVQTEDDDDEDDDNIPVPLPQARRQTSWYTDALLQSGGEADDLRAILGAAGVVDGGGGPDNNINNNAPVVDDDEVMEQYRIMAHVEASIRVKDNTGFDMAEYERRRKLQPEPTTKGEYYSGDQKPKPIVPVAKKIVPGSGSQTMSSMSQQEEPPLPSKPIGQRFVQSNSRIDRSVPELYPGVVLRGNTTSVSAGEHAVRCLGCQTKLRVNLLSTLVQCPDCSTVSPASSTRR
jgi:hypothetical protein